MFSGQTAFKDLEREFDLFCCNTDYEMIIYFQHTNDTFLATLIMSNFTVKEFIISKCLLCRTSCHSTVHQS